MTEPTNKASAAMKRRMGELLDLDNYEAYEAGHPGYLRNVELLMQEVRGLWNVHAYANPAAKFTVLELGAGPGTLLTKRLGDFLEETEARFGEQGRAEILINEYDAKSVEKIIERQKPREGDTPEKRKPVLNPHLTVLPPDNILNPMREMLKNSQKLDAIVSNFALHHLRPDEMDEFFALAGGLLKPGGKLLTGEEHLDKSDTPAERATVQIQYHGRVIEDALSRGLVKMPELEFAALVSGLKTTQEMFPHEQRGPGPHNTNDAAIVALERLIARTDKIRAQFADQGFDAWEEKEPQASKNHTISSDQERGELREGLVDLLAKLKASPTAGLDERKTEVTVYDPDRREQVSHTPIDRKVTLGEFMQMAGKSRDWRHILATRTGAGKDWGETYEPGPDNKPITYWREATKTSDFAKEHDSGVYMTELQRL